MVGKTTVNMFQSTAQSPESKLSAYISYLSFLTEKYPTHTSCINCLYERAVGECCLQPAIWLQYAEFLVRVIVSCMFPNLYPAP